MTLCTSSRRQQFIAWLVKIQDGWTCEIGQINVSVLTWKSVFRLHFFYLHGYNTLSKHLVHESLSYQKKDWGGHFLLVWHRLIRCFFEKQIDISFLLICSKSLCHTKERSGTAMRPHPSFGMTTTQAIRDHFAWHCQNNHTRQLPMGASHCPLTGYTEWNVYNLHEEYQTNISTLLKLWKTNGQINS